MKQGKQSRFWELLVAIIFLPLIVLILLAFIQALPEQFFLLLALGAIIVLSNLYFIASISVNLFFSKRHNN